ncbi:MAG: alpha/beta hydrolase fold domain-containing protein [Rhodobacteraceae bacterium]|nr:alpha/beta hydrolase fold domain-containing protein [Paracoccaceae bacterium]
MNIEPTTTKHLVDPELLAGLGVFPNYDANDTTLKDLRGLVDEMTLPEDAYAQDDVEIERLTIDGPVGQIAINVFRPRDAVGPLPAYLHMHPGGLIFGTAEQSNPANVCTASAVGCMVVSVDYRLAPEAKAPGALLDCYAALQWLHKRARELGVDPKKIAIGGESAGGGLAAALAQYARDQGTYPVCFQLLIAPMLDDRPCAVGNLPPHVGEFVWTRASNRYAWSCYLGQEPGKADTPLYAVPARMDDLQNLPPAYIQVGALDLFFPESVDYATRLLTAECTAELHVVPAAYHGFELIEQADVSARSRAEVRAALARAFCKVF